MQLELEREILLLRSFSHPHIVPFLGAFPLPGAGEVWVLLELCERGSLQEVVRAVGTCLARWADPSSGRARSRFSSLF